jgi:hypothetical protein
MRCPYLSSDLGGGEPQRYCCVIKSTIVVFAVVILIVGKASTPRRASRTTTLPSVSLTITHAAATTTTTSRFIALRNWQPVSLKHIDQLPLQRRIKRIKGKDIIKRSSKRIRRICLEMARDLNKLAKRVGVRDRPRCHHGAELTKCANEHAEQR